MTKIDEYEQKTINHIFHYTNKYEFLEGIINNGYQPSYCKEKLIKENYLSPMVSFCNIPIGEVDKYLRYGRNGIGMSMEWAIRKKVNPVLYIHEGSDYVDILPAKETLKNSLNTGSVSEWSDEKQKLLSQIKFWKSEHKNKPVNTYQEREWRFVPNLKKNLIIQERTQAIEYRNFTDSKANPKPHFPDHSLKIDEITDIKYIVTNTANQRKKIYELLKEKFETKAPKCVDDAILCGSLSILTASQIRNDF